MPLQQSLADASLLWRRLSFDGVCRAWHRTIGVKVPEPGFSGADLLARGAQARG
ncbi:MAG: hypothetical protein Q8O04_03160 [Deltaproteobacteria bacterium]|nr:hypothetical protein [Deltaproteobacteria bacterium]